MQRTLLAWIDRQRIGTLSDRYGIWSFRYAPAWLEAPGTSPCAPACPCKPKSNRTAARDGRCSGTSTTPT